jgi:aspartyl protease family protein
VGEGLHQGLSAIPQSATGEDWDRTGIVIGWALRWVLLCCGIVLLGVGLLDRGAALLPGISAPAGREGQAGIAAPPLSAPPSNTIVYTANERGHVLLDAAVNGAPVRMLVDTGASLVTLTPTDARAAGINPASLAFSGHVQTANGTARMAPVTLREIRVGQLSIYDLPAAVLENLNVSLLGMSFLSRLQGYEMRDGKLTITW